MAVGVAMRVPMRVVEAARALREALAGFDPALVTGDDAATVVEELARTEKACAGARVRAGARAVQAKAHERAGFADASTWLADAAGSSRGQARAEMELASALDACPATAEALAAGELSLAQARQVTRTEAACPGSEAEMLALARRSSPACLAEEGRRRRLGALDVEELHRRQQRARHLRHWVDDTGMVRLSGALPPLVGVALANRLDAETDRIRRQARAQGSTEAREAHAADALLSLVSGEGKGRATSAEVVVVCDLGAWRRGHAHAGEAAHVIGGGPLPVAVLREMAEDAFLKAVIHDGVQIHTVAHFGRRIPAHLRTALELGAPPGFQGSTCAEEGCGRRWGLEWDHVDPLANGGPTSHDNLAPRCWPHHRAKTEADQAAGLLGPRAGPDPPPAPPRGRGKAPP